MTKISNKQILEWIGDASKEEIAEYLAILLNKDYDLEASRKEILDYFSMEDK